MEKIKVTVPDALVGDWAIQSFVIDEAGADLYNFNATLQGHPDMFVVPGDYKRLVHRERGVVMSNTPHEVQSNLPFITRAKGSVLINGLGMGMVLTEIFKNPEVSHVTVVEREEDVIELTSKHFSWEIARGKLNIVHASCFEYEPPRGARYTAVWHDIWDDISDCNLDGMAELKAKYRHRTKWQGCWAEDKCKAMRKRLKDLCKQNGKSYDDFVHFANTQEVLLYADN